MRRHVAPWERGRDRVPSGMIPRLAALATVLLAAACGGANHKQVCSASVSARAEGQYRGQTPEAAEAASARHTYACRSACYDLYGTKMEPEDIYRHPLCVEGDLLKAAADPLMGVPDVQARCERGVQQACVWLEAHPEIIAASKRPRPSTASTATTATEPEPARPVMAPGEARAAIERAAAAISADAQSSGLVFVSDREYSLGDGGEVIELSLFSQTYYSIHVVGGRATRFTASLGGPNLDPIELPERGVSGDTFVRATGLNDETDRVGGEQRLYLRDADGDRGTVRVLVFKRY